MRTPLPSSLRLVCFASALALGGAGCGHPADEAVAGRFVSAPSGAPLRHLVLEGTPTAMGRAAGRLLRTEIRAAAERPLPESLRPSLEQYARQMRPLAPAALLEELDAMAAEAGVVATDLFLRESAREGLRWHDAAGAPRSASFASPPGPSSEVVVAFDGADAAAPDWLVVERHPKDGVATLVLARAGEVGAIGGITRAGAAVVASEIDLPAERRTLKGPPFSWSIRAALDGPGSLERAMGRIASLCGHRVLASDGANRRLLGFVTLAADAPRAFDANAWVLAAADDGEGPLTRAQENRLGAYPSRPGAGDASELARAGRAPSASGPEARWTRAGLRYGAFDYRWTID